MAISLVLVEATLPQRSYDLFLLASDALTDVTVSSWGFCSTDAALIETTVSTRSLGSADEARPVLIEHADLRAIEITTIFAVSGRSIEGHDVEATFSVRRAYGRVLHAERSFVEAVGSEAWVLRPREVSAPFAYTPR